MYSNSPGLDPTYLLVLAGGLFVHMCYQLSVSVLTYFASHTIGHKTSASRLLGLGISYGLGAVVTNTVLVFVLVTLLGTAEHAPRITGLVASLIAPLVAIATVAWYYRRAKGTELWLPRAFAHYLLERSRKTRSFVEACMLGAATVLGELPFIIAPLSVAVYLVSTQPGSTWLGWSALYSLVAYLPLFAVTGYLTSGHSVARVQRWREQNKTFLQWSSGAMLILLSLFLTTLQLGSKV